MELSTATVASPKRAIVHQPSRFLWFRLEKMHAKAETNQLNKNKTALHQPLDAFNS